jgi:hypothetical protein
MMAISYCRYFCGSARQSGHSLLHGIASVASIDNAKTVDMDVLSKHCTSALGTMEVTWLDKEDGGSCDRN